MLRAANDAQSSEVPLTTDARHAAELWQRFADAAEALAEWRERMN